MSEILWLLGLPIIFAITLTGAIITDVILPRFPKLESKIDSIIDKL